MAGQRLSHLIERIARLSAAGAWDADLNPTQQAALSYLARANRFSRSPSHVADYLGTTRGTASQTLKALARKGLIQESKTSQDRRMVSYSVTHGADRRVSAPDAIERASERFDTAELEDRLAEMLRHILKERGGRAFGICRGCRHHRKVPDGRRCALLDVGLTDADAGMICHEFAA
jgi:DNA-binding MarR family transcriptional regulator